MEVLKHCRVYPLSNYCAVEGRHFIDPQNNKARHVHLVEHNFKLTDAKIQLLERNMGDGIIIIVDVISCWKRYCKGKARTCYMNSASTLHLEGVINFLSQLIEYPQEALKRCQDTDVDVTSMTIQGIVIDNLSYYQTPSTSLRDFNILYKLLKTLRTTYGCWSLTTSYGLEYYNGVEALTAASYNSGTSYTKIPQSYIKEMDTVIVRDTPTSMHIQV